MDVDVIVCWPRNCDYPLWRAFIKENRDRFRQVFVAFTETHQGEDYRQFVKADLDKHRVTCFDSGEPGPNEDWRNNAVNLALSLCEAEIVWFTEQDLFVTDNKFFDDVARALITYDVVGYKEGGNRMHPANLWVYLETVRRTSMNFGIVEGKLDHFGQFYKDLVELHVPIHEMLYPSNSFYHMNGLSHNMTLLERGEEITYNPKEFRGYLAMCLEQDNLHPTFKKLAERGVEHMLEAVE